jgi:ABC-type nitrate/sulfonate/bicarbonate transport system substrate-binding protein
MTRKKITIILAALLIAGLAGIILLRRAPQTRSVERVEVSLRLPIPAADAAFAPYYLAVDKGIFAKYGLNVRLEPGSPELNPVKMVAQGTNDFGVLGGPELLLSARAKGVPLVGIAQLHKDSDFVVVLALRDSGITKPSDLQGKKVGFFYGHISTDVLRMLFSKERLKVQEVDVGFDYGQLLTRKIDAQWAFRTTAGISLPARGVELNVISPAEYGIVTQGHMIIAREQMLSERPDIAQKFLDAILEATAYSVEHIDESIEATMRRDPNFQKPVGQQQMAIYRATIVKNSRIGWIADEDMARTKEQMASVNLLPADFDVRPAYTRRLLEDYYGRNR